MAKHIKEYVNTCSICQQAKYSTQPLARLLETFPVPTHIWHDISMNFITGLPLSHICSVILVVVDRLSKFVHFIPLLLDFMTPKMDETFVREAMSIHSFPHSIVSD